MVSLFGLKKYICDMLVLLDIDGVMVKTASWRPLEILSDGFPAFSEQAIQALVEIIQKQMLLLC